MIIIAICDDDPYYREKEKRIVNDYLFKLNNQYEIHLYNDGKQILNDFYNGMHYDICFFDVSMKDIDGMQAALKMRKDGCGAVFAFITAYMTYALEGYKVNASRYIIKSPESLENNMIECLDATVKKFIVDENEYQNNEEVSPLLKLCKNTVYIESCLHKLIFHYQRGHNSAYGKLDDLEKLLTSSTYCRIHKSYLINLDNVKNIERYKVTLKNGEVINISKSKYKTVRERYFKYLGEF